MRVLYLIHDSRVPTQVEFVVDMQSKEIYKRLEALGVNLVHLDVSRHANVDLIVDIEKVSRKDKPTFLLRADDGLHKIESSSVNENFPEGIESEI